MKRNNDIKNIALLDLNHMMMGLHTNTVPLGIGMIARYLSINLPGIFDIRLFKDPEKFLHSLRGWRPDVLGVALYSWNSQLNLHMARRVKKACPSCVVIAGGPDLHLTRDERASYLRENSALDICVSQDGEIPFTETVTRLLGGESIADIRNAPPDGTYCLDPESGEFREAPGKAPRLTSLDCFGSMYADGWFDLMLDDGFHPFVQTHRGCPFKCVYCHTGDEYQSRMIFQSAGNFEQDMEYLGKRYSARHNVTLYMSNTNFGLFEEDFEIARILRRVQDKYDWPKNIIVNSGKDPDKLLALISILKYKFIPYISLQTLTPAVLKNIRRRNIPFKDFVRFQKAVTSTISENTTTELILSLPGETRKTFTDMLTTVLDSGVQNIVIYTLMSLKGTLLATPEYAARYGHVIRHRILPRCFSEVDGARIFETEEVVAGTNEMPIDDYIELRGLTLITTVFASSVEMYPVRKLILEHGLKVSDWIFGIYEKIKDRPGLYSAYRSFLSETEGELFETRGKLIEFFREDANYRALCDGRYGDNLIRKYKMEILSHHYKEFMEMALTQLRILSKGHLKEDVLDAILKDLATYLKTRDIGRIFIEGYREDVPRAALLSYDIPRWLRLGDESLPIERYHGSFPYSVAVSDYARERLKSFTDFKRDAQLSLQMLYRDGFVRDFWPVWVHQAKWDEPILERKEAVSRDIMYRNRVRGEGSDD